MSSSVGGVEAILVKHLTKQLYTWSSLKHAFIESHAGPTRASGSQEKPHPVRLNLSTRFISYGTLFFSHNKTASAGLSAAKTISWVSRSISHASTHCENMFELFNWSCFILPHLKKKSSKLLVEPMLELCQMGSPIHSQLALRHVLRNHHYIILFGSHFLFYTIFRWFSFITCVSVDHKNVVGVS